MKYVYSIKFKKKTGDLVYEEEVDQMWKIEEVQIEFDCPCCLSTNNARVENNLKKSTRHTCDNCYRRYFIYPVNSFREEKDIGEMDIEEKVETQLRSISRVYDIVEERPISTTRTAYYPDNAVLGVISVISASIALFSFILSRNPALTSNPLYYVILAAVSSATLGGIIAIGVGPGRYIYNNYRIYKGSEFEGSFVQYIMDMANYYHAYPFDLVR